MKNIKILTLAAVALLFGLTSCNNNDLNEVSINGDDFRVSLSFVKGGTYADGPAAVKGAKVDITDGYLLFANAAEMITDVYTITTGATAGKNIDAAALGATAVVLNKVSGASTKVYMLANKGTLAAIPAPAIGGTATAFMKSAMKVEDQAEYTEVTSTGNAMLVAGALPDERTAAITLATSVSRIQIADITFSGFTAGTLEGIFINNYYPTMELNGTAIGTLVGSLDAAEYVSGSTTFPTDLKGYVFDYGLAGNITAAVTPTGVWGYNLFTSATPQIILKLTGVETTGGTMGEQYVTIHGFKNPSDVDITTLAGGMIYTIGAGSLVVKPEDLGPTPGLKAIKVSVTVETVVWDETIVKPNL